MLTLLPHTLKPVVELYSEVIYGCLNMIFSHKVHTDNLPIVTSRIRFAYL